MALWAMVVPAGSKLGEYSSSRLAQATPELDKPSDAAAEPATSGDARATATEPSAAAGRARTRSAEPAGEPATSGDARATAKEPSAATGIAPAKSGEPAAGPATSGD